MRYKCPQMPQHIEEGVRRFRKVEMSNWIYYMRPETMTMAVLPI